ncbi:hypothetical protein CSC74_11370 [Pseudoxanthomonas yeongjuensis]|nr:hypothetical protein CSC74_11370 [Pseudoxanthomonas yeongjuensis]
MRIDTCAPPLPCLDRPIQSGRMDIAYGAIPSRLGCRSGPAPGHGRCQANSSKAVVAQNATAAITSHHSTLVGRTSPLCRRYSRATAQQRLQRARIENSVLMTPLPGPRPQASFWIAASLRSNVNNSHASWLAARPAKLTLGKSRQKAGLGPMELDRSEPLPPDLLAELAERGEVRIFARNQKVIAEGERSDCLYVLVSGELKVYTQDERGRELVYNVLRAGELFGELFLDGDVRSASVSALTEAHCIVVDQALTHGLIRSYPAFAEFLIRKLIARVRHATQLSKRLALNDVFERTVALLEQAARPNNGVRLIPAALTQQEIANRIGATREMVNHVIGELTRGGFLERNEKRELIITRELPRR